jgi:hypothetical protein
VEVVVKLGAGADCGYRAGDSLSLVHLLGLAAGEFSATLTRSGICQKR